MTRYRDISRGKSAADGPQQATTLADDQCRNLSATAVLTKNGESMKLIPWEDIWTSLRVARIRGNGEMIDVFYDTLFKEAVFDDVGAWSLDQKTRS
ncbi:MAG: hypothetical protein ACREP3_06135 [Candidatus Binatia bacterium]